MKIKKQSLSRHEATLVSSRLLVDSSIINVDCLVSDDSRFRKGYGFDTTLSNACPLGRIPKTLAFPAR
jgi:hypothetical protein